MRPLCYGSQTARALYAALVNQSSSTAKLLGLLSACAALLTGCGTIEPVARGSWQDAGHNFKVRVASGKPVRGTPLVTTPMERRVPTPTDESAAENLQMLEHKFPALAASSLVGRGVFTPPSNRPATKLHSRIEVFSNGSTALRSLIGFGAGMPAFRITGSIIAPDGTTILEFNGFRGYEGKDSAWVGSRQVINSQLDDFVEDFTEIIEVNLPQ